jgi:hypothetical protein
MMEALERAAYGRLLTEKERKAEEKRISRVKKLYDL